MPRNRSSNGSNVVVVEDGEFLNKTIAPKQRRSRKRTRVVKLDSEQTKPPQKEKFAEEAKRKFFDIKPLTENQSKYLKLLRTKDFIIGHGASGSGKTFLACIHASNRYLKGEVEKIVLVRPYEHVGRSIGMRPGDGRTKLTPLMQSMLQTIEMMVGKSHMEYMITHNLLVLEALEDIRGRSYSDSVLVIDEGQNVDIAAMKALLTRSGDNCQIIVCGDSLQRDIKTTPGIAWVIALTEKAKQIRPDVLNEENTNTLFNSIGHVEFTNADIVRSGLCSLFVKLFDWEASEGFGYQ